MKRIRLVLVLATCTAACSAVSDKADEFTTVSVGAEALSPVQIERTVMLGPERLPACLNLSLTLPSSNTTVSMQNTAGGCALSLQQPDITLLDEQEIDKARSQIGPFDVDGVRRGRVSVQQLELWDANGTPLTLSEYVASVSVQVDGDAVLDKTPATDVEGGTQLTRQVPDSLVQKIKDAVKNGQPATADVALTLWLQAQTLTNLPGGLKMNLVLQPELDINVVDAL